MIKNITKLNALLYVNYILREFTAVEIIRKSSFGKYTSEAMPSAKCQDFIQATIENASSELSSVFVCALFGRVEF